MTVVTSDGVKVLNIGSLSPDSPTVVEEKPIEPAVHHGWQQLDLETPKIAVGDMVFYTGKTSGKKREYMVGWAGECNRTGKPKLGLHCHGLHGRLFFVEESAVERVPMEFEFHSPV